MPTTRFTHTELESLRYAVSTCLAGTLDGIDEDSGEYERMSRSLAEALRKLEDRLGYR